MEQHRGGFKVKVTPPPRAACPATFLGVRMPLKAVILLGIFRITEHRRAECVAATDRSEKAFPRVAIILQFFLLTRFLDANRYPLRSKTL
jgi:hypothetical protein